MPITIERIGRDASDDLVGELASLLVDAVDSGAGVSFMAGLSLAEAASWWRQTLRASSPRAIILIARQAGEVAGTVQLQPAWAPNQPHRADIAKLIVHRKARRNGIARELMREVERLAKDAGFTLLLLDTCKGTAAEKKLAGAALTSFMTKCQKDAQASCDTAAQEKKLNGAAKTSFTKKCVKDATGA